MPVMHPAFNPPQTYEPQLIVPTQSYVDMQGEPR